MSVLVMEDQGSDMARIDAEARSWLLRVKADAGAEAACTAWRAADPRHERAFQDAWLVWTAIGRTSYARSDAWRSPRPRAGLARIAAPAAIAASLALAAVVAPGLLSPPDQRIRTETAQSQAVQLKDGSKVFVGARSALDVRFDEDARTAVLKDGEAFFEVARDPSRPFTVIAGDAVIRVTGTKFDVRRTPFGVQVSVLEGSVQVSRKPLLGNAAPKTPDRVLTDGEQVRLDRRAGLTTTQPATTDAGSWRSGRLLYAEVPLKEVVADANRYSDRPIRIMGDIGELHVTVSFRTTAVDELIANLDRALPIEAERQADGDILLRAEPAPG